MTLGQFHSSSFHLILQNHNLDTVSNVPWALVYFTTCSLMKGIPLRGKPSDEAHLNSKDCGGLTQPRYKQEWHLSIQHASRTMQIHLNSFNQRSIHVYTPPEMQMLREWSTCQYALGEASCVFLGISRLLEQCESGSQQTTETLTEAPCSAGPRASCRAYRLILPPSPPQRRCLMSPANPWRP